MSGEAGWNVSLPTVGVTCVRLAVIGRSAGAPWPLARAAQELASLGARREGPPRALGGGRGVPLLLAHRLRWRGLELHLEAHEGAIAEVSLELPPWDQLAAAVEAEAEVWDLVDTLAAAVEAAHGSIGDGEALALDPPGDPRGWASQMQRHIGLLVGASTVVDLGAGAADYRPLVRSGLRVLLR